MNSLRLFLSQLGSNLGVELVFTESAVEDSELYEIQLVGLNPKQTFTFVVSRSWRTTQIKLSPGPFAGQFVKYLCNQLLVNHEKVVAQIESRVTEFSGLRLEIDGLKISSADQKLSEHPNLCFDVEVLTAESSLSHGLVNKKEEELIEFAITLVVSVLPIVDNIFRNPDEVVGFPEGAIARVLVNKYERDPRNRRLAIELHGNSCQACDFNFKRTYGDLGALKTTTQKFYRINGGSTQLEGVSSDVVMPDKYSYIKMGERDVDNAMPWDKIDAADYSVWNKNNNISTAIENSKKRLANNNQFKLIDENAKWINERSEDHIYNLQIDKFKSEQKLLEETSKKYKSVLDYKNQLTFYSLPYENDMMLTDLALKEKRQRWHESLAKDIYVDEALNVLNDLQPKEVAKKTNVTLKKKDKLVKS